MASPGRWTPAQEAELRDLHGQGLTLTAIAKQIGRDKGAVSVKAKTMGLTWDRSATAAATRAKVADAKARRATIKLRLLSRVEHLLDRLEAEKFTTLVPDGPGSQGTRTLTFVPPDDEKALATSMSSYLASYDRLEKLDGDGGVADAVGMLDKIADAIKAAADTLGT